MDCIRFATHVNSDTYRRKFARPAMMLIHGVKGGQNLPKAVARYPSSQEPGPAAKAQNAQMLYSMGQAAAAQHRPCTIALGLETSEASDPMESHPVFNHNIVDKKTL